MKRLVLCLDGTWNNPEQEKDSKVSKGRVRYKPTNVLKTFRAVLPMGADEIPQVSFYLEGVGAFVGEKERFGRLQALGDRVFGGIYGGGFESRIKSAYRFLVSNFREGDEIYLFGFSRGAAQARSLSKFVDWAGGILHKRDEYYIPELFDAYRDTRARQGAAREVLADIRGRGGRGESAVQDLQPARIKFLGVYDTVISLGSRLRADLGETAVATVETKYSFHVDSRPPAIVLTARQALAIDERRWDFRPQIWEGLGSSGQSMEQRWFPGAHSNVGGGYDPDGLANFPLRWMMREARSVGLQVDDDYLRHFAPSTAGELRNEHRALVKIVEFLRGKLNRGKRSLIGAAEQNFSIDEAAVRLLLEREEYRPSILLEALRSELLVVSDVSDGHRKKVEQLLLREERPRR